MPKTEKKTPKPAPVAVMPDLQPAAAVIDAAALLAQVSTPTAPDAPAPLTDADLRKLADSRATVGGKTDPAVSDAIFAMLKAATPEQVAQSAADAAKAETSTKKIAGKQKDIRKAEKAAKVEERHEALRAFLKAERAADRFCSGTHRLDVDYDAATATPVKGKSREKAGGERNAVTKETLAEHKVSAFVLADDTDATAVSRGQTVKAHPYAYMNGAHPTRPYFGLNLFTEGMTEEDAVKVRKEHGLDGELSKGQKAALKNGRLTFGDDPARLLYKLGKDDATTRVRFADGSTKTVARFIAELDGLPSAPSVTAESTKRNP